MPRKAAADKYKITGSAVVPLSPTGDTPRPMGDYPDGQSARVALLTRLGMDPALPLPKSVLRDIVKLDRVDLHPYVAWAPAAELCVEQATEGWPVLPASPPTPESHIVPPDAAAARAGESMERDYPTPDLGMVVDDLEGERFLHVDDDYNALHVAGMKQYADEVGHGEDSDEEPDPDPVDDEVNHDSGAEEPDPPINDGPAPQGSSPSLTEVRLRNARTYICLLPHDHVYAAHIYEWLVGRGPMPASKTKYHEKVFSDLTQIMGGGIDDGEDPGMPMLPIVSDPDLVHIEAARTEAMMLMERQSDTQLREFVTNAIAYLFDGGVYCSIFSHTTNKKYSGVLSELARIWVEATGDARSSEWIGMDSQRRKLKMDGARFRYQMACRLRDEEARTAPRARAPQPFKHKDDPPAPELPVISQPTRDLVARRQDEYARARYEAMYPGVSYDKPIRKKGR